MSLRLLKLPLLLLMFPGLVWGDSFESQLEDLEGCNLSKVDYFQGEKRISETRIPEGARVKLPSQVSLALLTRLRTALENKKIFSHIDFTLSGSCENVHLSVLLSPHLILRKTEFRGTLSYSQRELRRIAGLRLGEPINYQRVLAAATRVQEALSDQGFYHANVDIVLSQDDSLSTVLARFTIREGYRSQIESIELVGDFPPDLDETIATYRTQADGAIASSNRIEELRFALLRELRNDGYLQASVRLGGIRYNDTSRDITVTFAVETLDPLSIYFSGNTVFSNEELFELLRLNTRTAPFGPNAISRLVQAITKTYQARGFYKVSVAASRQASLGNRKQFAVSIDEGEQYAISKILFRGNASIPAPRLTKTLETKARGRGLFVKLIPGYLQDHILERDTEALAALYERDGFYDAKISPKIQINNETNRIELLFEIDEGTQTRVGEVSVFWVDGRADSVQSQVPDLVKLIPRMQAGSVFRISDLDSARADLVTRIQERGFPDVQVAPSYDLSTGAVSFRVTLNQRVRVGEIFIQGNRTTRDSLIQDHLQVKQGGPWDPKDFRETREALYKLGVFQHVELHAADGTRDEPVEDVTLIVSERDTGTFGVGTSYNTEDGVGLQAELSQRNVFGLAHQFSLNGEAFFQDGEQAIDAARGRLGYKIPRVLFDDGELYSELFVQEAVEFAQEFSYDRLGASFIYRLGLTEDLSSDFGHTIFSEKVFDVPSEILAGPEDSGTTFYSISRAEFTLDKRDDVYNPRNGYETNLSLLVADDSLGSDVSYFGGAFSQSVFAPLSSTLTWAGRFRFEALEPFGNTDVIPLGRRLFLGGRTSLRGYSPNSIGPRVSNGFIAGGDRSILLNSELHYEFNPDILAVLFLDIGQAIIRNKQNFEGQTRTFSKLRYSPGIGIRYRSPIGPIGADLGFAVNQESGEEFARFSLSIGNIF